MLCTSLINLARSASDSVSIESEIGIADVALLVDSSDYEGSFRSVRSFWHPFLSLKRPDLRVILAGSKVDLRSGDNVRSIDSSQKIFDAWLVFLFPPPFECAAHTATRVDNRLRETRAAIMLHSALLSSVSTNKQAAKELPHGPSTQGEVRISGSAMLRVCEKMMYILPAPLPPPSTCICFSFSLSLAPSPCPCPSPSPSPSPFLFQTSSQTPSLSYASRAAARKLTKHTSFLSGRDWVTDNVPDEP